MEYGSRLLEGEPIGVRYDERQREMFRELHTKMTRELHYAENGAKRLGILMRTGNELFKILKGIN